MDPPEIPKLPRPLGADRRRLGGELRGARGRGDLGGPAAGGARRSGRARRPPPPRRAPRRRGGRGGAGGGRGRGARGAGPPPRRRGPGREQVVLVHALMKVGGVLLPLS